MCLHPLRRRPLALLRLRRLLFPPGMFHFSAHLPRDKISPSSSLRTRHTKPRRSFRAATFRTHSPMSWLTNTTHSVRPHNTRKATPADRCSQGLTTTFASLTTSPLQRSEWTTLRSSSSSRSRVRRYKPPELTVLTGIPGWKRLLFADGPRQSINALTLYAFYLSKEDDGPFWQVSKYFDGDYITSALTVSTAFTVFVFALSLLMLIIAGICYIPLLCHIQGNLKVKRIYIYAWNYACSLSAGILLPQSRQGSCIYACTLYVRY